MAVSLPVTAILAKAGWMAGVIVMMVGQKGKDERLVNLERLGVRRGVCGRKLAGACRLRKGSPSRR